MNWALVLYILASIGAYVTAVATGFATWCLFHAVISHLQPPAAPAARGIPVRRPPLAGNPGPGNAVPPGGRATARRSAPGLATFCGARDQAWQCAEATGHLGDHAVYAGGKAVHRWPARRPAPGRTPWRPHPCGCHTRQHPPEEIPGLLIWWHELREPTQ